MEHGEIAKQWLEAAEKAMLEGCTGEAAVYKMLANAETALVQHEKELEGDTKDSKHE